MQDSAQQKPQVSAVVDVGGGYWNFEVRDRANGQIYAPRTAVAGPLVSTVSRPQMDIGDPPIIEVDSPEMARELVRKQLEYEPDLIKIWFIVPRDGDFTPNLPIIEATIDEAHDAGPADDGEDNRPANEAPGGTIVGMEQAGFAAPITGKSIQVSGVHRAVAL